MNLHEVLFASKMTKNSENSEADFSEYVKKTDYATKEKTGVMRPGGGLDVRNTGVVEVASATNAEILAGTNNYKPIVPANLASAMSAYGINSKTQIEEMLSTLAGETVTGKTYDVDNTQYTASVGAEIFNDYANNVAVGEYSHAEGNNTKAIGACSHAEGSGTTADGACSHSEGSNTKAIGACSHAEGNLTKAVGTNSHAEGSETTSEGICSHAEGAGTIATSDSSHAMGRYNAEDTERKFAFIIGNGKSASERSNAFAIDWQGNIYIGNSDTSVNVLDLMNRLSALETNTISGGN